MTAKYELFSTEYRKQHATLSDNTIGFAQPLTDIMNRLKGVTCDDGFNRTFGTLLLGLRYQLKKDDEATAIMSAAGALSVNATDKAGRQKVKFKQVSDAEIKKAAAIKFLRHVYMSHVYGGKEIWIVSTPKAYKTDISEELKKAGRSELDQYACLGDVKEQFNKQQRKQLGESTIEAQRMLAKTLIELNKGANDVTHPICSKVKLWFAGAHASFQTVKSDIRRLIQDLTKVQNLINTNKLIYTDMPCLRYSTVPEHMRFANSIAFVFSGMHEGIPIIYIEKSFFKCGKWILSEKLDWANTVIHEITHLVLSTKDHRYRYQELSPDKHLTPAQAYNNADQWGLFCADACCMLTDYQRNGILYGVGKPPPNLAPPPAPPKVRKNPPPVPPKIRKKA